MKVFEHCAFPLESTNTLVGVIQEKIDAARPLSMLRLGDGEGLVLARPSPGDLLLWERIVFHFGPKTTPEQVNQLADMLGAAVSSADVVGVRDDIVGVDFPSEYLTLSPEEFLHHFRLEFNLRPIDQQLAYKHAIRLALLHSRLCVQPFKQNTVFVSAWAHFDLSSSGELIRLLHSQDTIGLISSKNTLPGSLEKLLDIKVRYLQVPDIHEISKQVHFPDVFEAVMSGLEVDFAGQLFLVGAGICGKIYCQKIRELGGIALDIGSVCDAWCDVPSRMAVYRDKYDYHGDQVPDVLSLACQVKAFKEAQWREP